MKKIVVFLLLGFASFLLLAGNSAYADDELVDLYPYDQQACLEATNECTQLKVGSSHWTMEYAGHRYHFVKGAARFAVDLEDDNSNGFISAAEMGAVSWNAFASLTINDSDQQIILETANSRTDLTSVVHRKYSYFDELGQLQMFEDHISVYYIHNDGTLAAPDWRLATEVEATAYDTAVASGDPLVDTPNTRLTHIRMALDDVDADGYVIEPLGYLTWTNADVDTAVETDPEDWSTIINGDGVLFNGDPNFVVIPAGWTVVSWGTLDRGTDNPLTTAYIEDMPGFMLDETLDPMVTIYDPQPATFAGLTALDDDLVNSGVNIVVDYEASFNLPLTVSASWLNMFDTEGNIINSTEKLDYSVTISQDGTDLETIDFTYDSGTDSYTASAPVTAIDSTDFGATYLATWTTETPEEDVTTATADIVVGVMPPKFNDLGPRYVDSGMYVDLIGDVTADDGYGNDKTDDIIATYPSDFNPYNPMPGTYEIELEFLHNVFIAGRPADPNVDINGTVVTYDPETELDADLEINLHTELLVFTDADIFRASATGYGSVMVVVSADGTMKERYDRYNWNHTTSEGTTEGSEALFNAWRADLVLEKGEVVLAAHGSVHTPPLRAANLSYGDPITIDVGTDDLDKDIITTASYMLTVDDVSAPILMVVNENYSIYAGEYDNKDDAILANVVAYDFTDGQDDLVKYVSNNGGLDLTTPGSYTVEVTVEDVAGNQDVKSFNIIVKEAMLTEADVEALIEDNTLSTADIQALIDASVFTEADIVTLIEANVLSEEDVQDLIDAGVITEAQIQELIDASLPEDTGCGSAITGTSAIFATFSILLGAAAIFFIRKRR